MASILVIEDDTDVRAFVRDVLKAEGYDVREAGDGDEGIAIHDQHPADLVICDLFMPEKEGLATIRELHQRHPQVKIVAMSGGGNGHGRLDFLPLAKKFGAVKTLHKPLHLRVLLATVQELLQGSG